ncbi:MAG: DUF1444 family protein [Verrucomicrobia bacterium]|nr:DUF1444 family protein [Verrucomicrobiota bacterium]
MNLVNEASKNLDTVVPRIYVSLPKGVPADIVFNADDSPVERLLVADLLVFYAFDVGTHYELVANRDLGRLDVSPDELHERALANLRAMNLEVRAHQRPESRTLMLTAGGNYEATLILLPEFWLSVGEMVTGQIVAAVPARDILLVTGDADPANLAELRRLTSRSIERADKPLSRAFIRWNGTQWEEYSGFAA